MIVKTNDSRDRYRMEVERTDRLPLIRESYILIEENAHFENGRAKYVSDLFDVNLKIFEKEEISEDMIKNEEYFRDIFWYGMRMRLNHLFHAADLCRKLENEKGIISGYTMKRTDLDVNFSIEHTKEVIALGEIKFERNPRKYFVVSHWLRSGGPYDYGDRKDITSYQNQISLARLNTYRLFD